MLGFWKALPLGYPGVSWSVATPLETERYRLPLVRSWFLPTRKIQGSTGHTGHQDTSFNRELDAIWHFDNGFVFRAQ
jgi:hypothetical protein